MLPAGNGEAFAVARVCALVAIGMIAACDPGPAGPSIGARNEQPMTWSSRTPLSLDWAFLPASNATAKETGAITVTPMISPQGPMRTLKAADGGAIEAVLVGPVDLATRYNGDSLRDILSAQNNVPGMLYQVTSETPSRDGRGVCGATPASHLVWLEPELIEHRRLDLAVLSGGAPGAASSSLCALLRYSRSSQSASN